jgi:spoIIIJ-associated protein
VEKIEKTAATVEEALDAALEELGVSEQEADVDIVQEPKGGLLGLGSKEAVVRVSLKKAADEISEDELDEQADIAADFLQDLLDKMDLDADVEPHFVDGIMYVEIWGAEGDDEMGILIGRHGSVLDGMQELVKVIVGHRTGTRCRLVVDVEDYQKRRRSRLVSKAKDAAKRAQRSGKPEKLEPMNAFERKIVHDVISSIRGVESESEGEEPDRRVVVRKRASSPAA